MIYRLSLRCVLGLHSWWYKHSCDDRSSFRERRNGEEFRSCGRCGQEQYWNGARWFYAP